MNGGRVGIAAALCGIALATGACSDEDDPSALAGHWEVVGETISDGKIVSSGTDEGFESLVIYEDGKLSVDNSCSGVMETVGDGGQWRLNLDCGAAKLICDATVVTDVAERDSGDGPFDEALHVTCPDDDVDHGDEYVFAREADKSPTNAPTT
jgi:hypothetical protein